MLNVLVLTRDDALAADVERVCVERAHTFVRVEHLRSLGSDVSGVRPSVLLLDWSGSAFEAVATSSAISAVYPSVDIVIATESPTARSEGGFRVVDRWRTAERIVDELELAWLGLPASVAGPGGWVQPNG